MSVWLVVLVVKKVPLSGKTSERFTHFLTPCYFVAVYKWAGIIFNSLPKKSSKN